MLLARSVCKALLCSADAGRAVALATAAATGSMPELMGAVFGDTRVSARVVQIRKSQVARQGEPRRKPAGVPSAAHFALAVSAHPAGVRAILLIGTTSARLKREPFAALYACAQIHIPVNRHEELNPKCVNQAVWTNAKSRRGAQRFFLQKQSDWHSRAGRVVVRIREVVHCGANSFAEITNYFAEITCPLRRLPKFNGSAHLPNVDEPLDSEPAEGGRSVQWPVAISEIFNSIFGSWRLRKLKECGWSNLKEVKTSSQFGTGLELSEYVVFRVVSFDGDDFVATHRHSTLIFQ
jgi:hypothetical protein